MQKIKGLFRRNSGIFYLRLLRPKEIWISLRTRDPHKAMMVAIRITAEVDMNYEEKLLQNTLKRLKSGETRDFTFNARTGELSAEGKEDTENLVRAIEALNNSPALLDAMQKSADAQAQAFTPVQTPAQTPCPPISLKDAFEKYIENCKLKKNAPRTVEAKKYHLQAFTEILDEATMVDAIDKSSIGKFKAHLQDEKKTGKTIDNHLLTLHDCFNYLKNNALCNLQDNPIAGMFIQSKSEREKNTESYDQFKEVELKLIFDPTVYLNRMNSPDFFWVPLIAFYTGMRISEIGSLKVDDFKADNNVHYIYVSDSKTKSGERPVPIHSELLALGILDYVNDVKALGKTSLFPFRTQAHKRIHKRAQEKFAEYRAEIGITGANKSAHSFRVGFITNLVNHAGDQAIQIRRITGHSIDNSSGAKIQAGYVRDLPNLAILVEKFKYENFAMDINQLRYIPGHFSAKIAVPPPATKTKKPKTAKPKLVSPKTTTANTPKQSTTKRSTQTKKV